MSLAIQDQGRPAMHDLIEELRRFHSKKSYHLNLLDRAIADLSKSQQSTDTRPLLRELFEPFDDPAEIAHHHNEELILRELLTTDIPIHRKVTEISADHEAFDRITARIVSKIENPQIEIDILRANIQEFLVIYNDHANGEENVFFPLADRNLQDSHWNKVYKSWIR